LVCATATLVLLVGGGAAAHAAELTGTTFKDLNRDGVQEADEPVLSGQQLYLYDAASGTYLGTRYTDSAGVYSFAALADGDYRVQYASPSWYALRDAWVPTTTGGIRPRISLHVSGSTTASFGWRPIVRSTDPAAPITTYTAPSGLTVQSYDDVVTAREIHDTLSRGTLMGAEAQATAVRFDLSAQNMTNTSVAGSPGSFSNYRAIAHVTYGSWLEGDDILFHEYGHAWSLYYAYLAQQDDTLAGYLKARGLTGDPRVGSTTEWSPREMIAEDYRQLFGTATAQAPEQMNRDIPRPADVPGLRDYLATAFRQPVAAPAQPPPAPAPDLAVAGLAVNPAPVVNSGTASFTLSADAAATVKVLDAKGATVRTLLSAAARQSGPVSAPWDRLDASGRRVRKGTYSVRVDLRDASGRTASATRSFAVADR
jgi:hypothetical protein